LIKNKFGGVNMKSFEVKYRMEEVIGTGVELSSVVRAENAKAAKIEVQKRFLVNGVVVGCTIISAEEM
jgi:hypothetical protein